MILGIPGADLAAGHRDRIVADILIRAVCASHFEAGKPVFSNQARYGSGLVAFSVAVNLAIVVRCDGHGRGRDPQRAFLNGNVIVFRFEGRERRVLDRIGYAAVRNICHTAYGPDIRDFASYEAVSTIRYRSGQRLAIIHLLRGSRGQRHFAFRNLQRTGNEGNVDKQLRHILAITVCNDVLLNGVLGCTHVTFLAAELCDRRFEATGETLNDRFRVPVGQVGSVIHLADVGCRDRHGN